MNEIMEESHEVTQNPRVCDKNGFDMKKVRNRAIYSNESIKKNNMSETNIMYDIISNGLKQRMGKIRRDVLKQLDDQFNDMVKDILKKVDEAGPSIPVDPAKSNKYRDKIKSSSGILPSKIFLERNSLLTDLYKNKHISAIYNMFLTIVIILFINTAIHDIVTTGSPKLGMDTIVRGFGKITTVFYLWLPMKSSTLAVYLGYCTWANKRDKFSQNSFQRKAWDYMWLLFLILYQMAFVYLPTMAVVDQDLPVASSLIILMEQVRLIMKTHAFVRSATPRFLTRKSHTETPMPKAPTLSQYVYFMFAPTLIYQDSYPKANKIRWKVILMNVFEVILIIFCVTFIYDTFLGSVYFQSGTKTVKWQTLILSILASAIPSILFFLCGFYLLLHSWMNAFAELLRFSDKMFYKDWWNSTSFAEYYRTWNVVVHDWLYTYVYKDVYEILTSRNKPLSIFTVILVSAIAHEYILAFAFRFFYPVLLILFAGPGLIFFTTEKAGNVFIWIGLTIGSGTLMSLYCIEYFARINCPPNRNDILDFFVPRTWPCVLSFEG